MPAPIPEQPAASAHLSSTESLIFRVELHESKKREQLLNALKADVACYAKSLNFGIEIEDVNDNEVTAKYIFLGREPIKAVIDVENNSILCKFNLNATFPNKLFFLFL